MFAGTFMEMNEAPWGLTPSLHRRALDPSVDLGAVIVETASASYLYM